MSRRSLMFLTHRVPHPPNRGDRIRTFHFLEHLAARADVWLGCLADEPVPDETWRVLRRICKRVSIVPVEPKRRWLRAGFSLVGGGTATVGAFQSARLMHVVREWAAQQAFDATLCSSSALSPYLRLPELGSATRCVDLIDIDSQKWFDFAKASSGPKRWFYQTEGQRLQNLEAELSDWTDGITVVSEPEATLYRRFRPDGPIQAIPNGVDTGYFSTSEDPAGNGGCVFVGALDYRPNVDGIVEFVRNVWPEVHRVRRDQTLKIVGREPVGDV